MSTGRSRGWVRVTNRVGTRVEVRAGCRQGAQEDVLGPRIRMQGVPSKACDVEVVREVGVVVRFTSGLGIRVR